MSRFLFGLGGKWIILLSLVFKTALFTVIILIKSVPSTTTQSKIACVFGEGPGRLPIGMVVAKKSKKSKKIKKSKKSKNQKNQKKIKTIQKHYKKTWRPNIWVFACEPGSVLGYLSTLLCTALVQSECEMHQEASLRNLFFELPMPGSEIKSSAKMRRILII